MRKKKIKPIEYIMMRMYGFSFFNNYYFIMFADLLKVVNAPGTRTLPNYATIDGREYNIVHQKTNSFQIKVKC